MEENLNTPNNTQDKIKQLEDRIKQLEDWVSDKKVQQISFPVDEVSRTILNNL
jgi:hypothetical protein